MVRKVSTLSRGFTQDKFFQSNWLFQPYMGKGIPYPTNDHNAYPFWFALKGLLSYMMIPQKFHTNRMFTG